MKIKLKDLPNGVCGIYKINFPNGKIYIGQSVDIKRRIMEHNTPSAAKTPCDKAINKYGKIVEIELLEYTTQEELNLREQYWIKFFGSNKKEIGYNLTIGGDTNYLTGENNLKSVFSNSQVLDVRRRRFNGERKKDVYMDYKDFSFATFEKIWLGKGYPEVGKEYIIQPNTKTRQEYSSEANSGLKNGRSKMTMEQIVDIRNKYDNGMSLSEIHKLYNFVSKSTIRRIALREVYKNIQ